MIDLINDGSGLGFGIIGGKSTGVVVKTILPGGVADRVSLGNDVMIGILLKKCIRALMWEVIFVINIL